MILESPILRTSTEEYLASVEFKTMAYQAEADFASVLFEVKRARAIWDPDLGPNGGFRCPPGTRYAGRYTDRFARNCGWSVSRRIGQRLEGLGRQMSETGEDRRDRRVARAAERSSRRATTPRGRNRFVPEGGALERLDRAVAGSRQTPRTRRGDRPRDRVSDRVRARRERVADRLDRTADRLDGGAGRRPGRRERIADRLDRTADRLDGGAGRRPVRRERAADRLDRLADRIDGGAGRPARPRRKPQGADRNRIQEAADRLDLDAAIERSNGRVPKKEFDADLDRVVNRGDLLPERLERRTVGGNGAWRQKYYDSDGNLNSEGKRLNAAARKRLGGDEPDVEATKPDAPRPRTSRPTRRRSTASMSDVLGAPEPEMRRTLDDYKRSLKDRSDEELDADAKLARSESRFADNDEDRALLDEALEAIDAEKARREAKRPAPEEPEKATPSLDEFTDEQLLAKMRRLGRRGRLFDDFDIEDLSEDDLDRLDSLIIENRRMFPDRDRSPHPAVELVMGEVNRRTDIGRDRRDTPDDTPAKPDIDDVLDAPEPEIDAYEAAYGRSLADLSDEELDAEISMLRRRRKGDLLDEDREIVDRAIDAATAERKRREAPASPRRRRGSPVNVQRLDDVERSLMEEALANERDRLQREWRNRLDAEPTKEAIDAYVNARSDRNPGYRARLESMRRDWNAFENNDDISVINDLGETRRNRVLAASRPDPTGAEPDADAMAAKPPLPRPDRRRPARRPRPPRPRDAVRETRPTGPFSKHDPISPDEYRLFDPHTEDGPWGKIPEGKRPAYGVIVVDDDGRVLMREPANHFDGYHWTFPKGRPDPDEHPIDAALREAREETGWETEPIGFLPGRHDTGSSSTFFMVARLKPGTKRDDAIWRENEETWSVNFVDFDEAQEKIGNTTNAAGRRRDLAVLDAAREAVREYGESPESPGRADLDRLSPLPGREAEVDALRARPLPDGLEGADEFPDLADDPEFGALNRLERLQVRGRIEFAERSRWPGSTDEALRAERKSWERRAAGSIYPSERVEARRAIQRIDEILKERGALKPTPDRLGLSEEDRRTLDDEVERAMSRFRSAWKGTYAGHARADTLATQRRYWRESLGSSSPYEREQARRMLDAFDAYDREFLTEDPDWADLSDDRRDFIDDAMIRFHDDIVIAASESDLRERYLENKEAVLTASNPVWRSLARRRMQAIEDEMSARGIAIDPLPEDPIDGDITDDWRAMAPVDRQWVEDRSAWFAERIPMFSRATLDEHIRVLGRDIEEGDTAWEREGARRVLPALLEERDRRDAAAVEAVPAALTTDPIKAEDLAPGQPRDEEWLRDYAAALTGASDAELDREYDVWQDRFERPDDEGDRNFAAEALARIQAERDRRASGSARDPEEPLIDGKTYAEWVAQASDDDLAAALAGMEVILRDIPSTDVEARRNPERLLRAADRERISREAIAEDLPVDGVLSSYDTFSEWSTEALQFAKYSYERDPLLGRSGAIRLDMVRRELARRKSGVWSGDGAAITADDLVDSTVEAPLSEARVEDAASRIRRILDKARAKRRRFLADYVKRRYGTSKPWMDRSLALSPDELADMVRRGDQDGLMAWSKRVFEHNEIPGADGARFRTRINRVRMDAWEGNSFTVYGDVLAYNPASGNWEKVGKIERWINHNGYEGSNGSIYNAYLMLGRDAGISSSFAERMKGKGFQGVFNPHAWMWARAGGFRQVRVSAGGSDGTYVWGRVGFRSDDDYAVRRLTDAMAEQVTEFRAGRPSLIKQREDADAIEAMVEHNRRMDSSPADSYQWDSFILAVSNTETDATAKKAREKEIKDWFQRKASFSSGAITFDDEIVRLDPVAEFDAPEVKASPSPVDPPDPEALRIESRGETGGDAVFNRLYTKYERARRMRRGAADSVSRLMDVRDQVLARQEEARAYLANARGSRRTIRRATEERVLARLDEMVGIIDGDIDARFTPGRAADARKRMSILADETKRLTSESDLDTLDDRIDETKRLLAAARSSVSGSFSLSSDRARSVFEVRAYSDRLRRLQDARSAAEAAGGRRRFNGDVIDGVRMPTFDDLRDFREVPGPRGSSGGTWHTDQTSGRTFFMKPARSEAHARNEVAMAAIYRAAGVPVPHTAVTAGPDGRTYVISEKVDAGSPLTPGDVNRIAREGMGIDMLLSNWDVHGASGDNVLVDAAGRVVRIDLGGAGRYRARGELRPSFGPGATWTDPATMLESPQGRALYGHVTNEEFAAAMRRAASLDLERVRADLDRIGVDRTTRDDMLSTLRERQAEALRLSREFASARHPSDVVEVDGTAVRPGGGVTPGVRRIPAYGRDPRLAMSDQLVEAMETPESARTPLQRQAILDHKADLIRAFIDMGSSRSGAETRADRLLGERSRTVSLRIGERNGLTPEQQAEVRERAERWLQNPVTTMINPEAFLSVLSDGRFKTQHETGTSRGSLAPGIRRSAELFMFGFPDAEDYMDPSLRPYYGHIPENLNEISSSVAHYGRIRVVFKDEVRGRTMYTGGDSLGQDYIPAPISGGVSDSALQWSAGWSRSGPSPAASYMETQTLGGLSVEDISEVLFREGDRTNPESTRVMRRLDDMGIPYRFI